MNTMLPCLGVVDGKKEIIIEICLFELLWNTGEIGQYGAQFDLSVDVVLFCRSCKKFALICFAPILL